MALFDGQVVLVAGGTGGVGEGIVKAFAREGATVVVPSRSKERLDALAAQSGDDGRLFPIQEDLGTSEGAHHVRSEVATRFARLDAVVASVRQWQPGQLLGMEPAAWQAVLDQNLTLHWSLARTLLPLVAPGGSYTLINGLSSEIAFPGAGANSVMGAAQHMLKDALHVDLAATGSQVRINELMLGLVATRKRAEHRPEWLTPDDVGNVAVQVADSDIRGETLRLPDRAAAASVFENLRALTA